MIHSLPTQSSAPLATINYSNTGQGTLNFEEFYDKYAPAFYGEIKRWLFKDEISQHVLEDVFKKMYQSPESISAAKEKVFISALKLVRKEISRKKIDIVLSHILQKEGNAARVALHPVL